jgi:pSer/pThr/pTyr-binding forkhead associated (FHA) protein
VLRNPQGREFVVSLLPGTSVTVGRDLSVEVPILDAGVSRHHSVFTFDGEDLWLQDLHSQNGTYVNAERIHVQRVRSGDVITFGRVSLVLCQRFPRGEDEGEGEGEGERAGGGEEEETPQSLGALSSERLVELLELVRQLAGEDPTRQHVGGRFLDLARAAARADGGALLLWDEAGRVLHPLAASPQDLFPRVSRLLSRELAASIFHERRALLLEALPGEPRRALDPSAPAGAGAVALPLAAGGKALAIAYLERASSRGGFQPSEVEFLSALAWAAGPVIGASLRPAAAALLAEPSSRAPLEGWRSGGTTAILRRAALGESGEAK